MGTTVHWWHVWGCRVEGVARAQIPGMVRLGGVCAFQGMKETRVTRVQ